MGLYPRIWLFTGALSAVLVAACDSTVGGTATEQGRFEKIASGYCECTAQLARLNQQADTAARDQMGVYFKKMQAEYLKVKDCMASIIGQFGHLKAPELDTVNTLLKTRCPELADKREQLQELLGE